MSDQQPTNQEPQPKKKHAGGRPKKPKPVPPLPPPEPGSLEETLDMGDRAALGASPASRLRWCSDRVQILKDIQARDDAARDYKLENDNKRLKESVDALERTKQNLENELVKKDRDLVAAKTENDTMATSLKEMATEHAKQLDDLRNKLRACERNAQGLFAFLRCVCLQVKDLCGGKRIEYAARLMHFSEQAGKKALQLTKMIDNPETRRRYADWHWRKLQGPVGEGRGCSPEAFAYLSASVEQAIEGSMQEDREKLKLELSNIIPGEVMNQAIELLDVSRGEFDRQLDTLRQGRKD
jgi:hypothetical protein